MLKDEVLNSLERCPVIAAVHDDEWQTAINSPMELIFYLKANLLTVEARVAEAKSHGKTVFVHIDLSDGIGKDKTGIEFLLKAGVEGIISTRTQLINIAHEKGMTTVQRLFALDSQGLESIRGISSFGAADLIEIMPGVIPKVVEMLTERGITVIAGGLIETKSEVTAALSAGAVAVSTSKNNLWNI